MTQSVAAPQGVEDRFRRSGPKRILSLDGGGVRGVLTLGILRTVEAILRKRHGDRPDFRLCQYFDLIAGTSTGAIIAAALALGMSVDEITRHYHLLGASVFRKRLFRRGYVRSAYRSAPLVRELKSVLGEDTCLGGPEIKTGLLILTKRLDSGSCWPLSNNPSARYFEDVPDRRAGNRRYPLWKVVRASTAAPKFFAGEKLSILNGSQPSEGLFIDGGVSPHNNPSLQAMMFVTVGGYNVNWPTGKDRLLMISVGTGRPPSGAPRSMFELGNAVRSLLSLMDDCNDLVETMMQWMASGATHRTIDSELGNLEKDLLAAESLLTYQRYNAIFDAAFLNELLEFAFSEKQTKRLRRMDAAENMQELENIGCQIGERFVIAEHFPSVFDIE